MEGTVTAEAGDRAVDYAGVYFLEDIIADPKLLHYAGAIVFYNNISLFDHFKEHFFALFGLQIQSDPLFVAVYICIIKALSVFKRRKSARIVTALRVFDFDNIGSQVSQEHGAVRARHYTGQVKNCDIAQCVHKLSPLIGLDADKTAGQACLGPIPLLTSH